jgi:NADH-quinone oxidoreductase subunit K
MELLNSLLIFSMILYTIGLYCMIAKRNMIRLLLGVGILGNAANINFIGFSIFKDALASKFIAYTTVIILMVLEACLMAVGLSIILVAVKHYKTLDAGELKKLRW